MDGNGLLGRQRESRALTGLVGTVRGGSSQVLVLRGEAGIGKTALLDLLGRAATGCRIARAAGVESEMELPFAALHQLCGPHLDRIDDLPPSQCEALGTAFRLRSGAAPDPFVVGLAVLTLFSLVAEDRPLICVVDDAQWLDQASARALEFVARRLAAEPVGLVLAVRDPVLFDGLPAMTVRGLGDDDAAALLDSAAPGGLDPRVRERILAECRGNPLALLELPRGLSRAELAFGGATDAEATPLVHRLERGFQRQLASLPAASRRLLLIAAADPVGDAGLLWLAAARLGIGDEAAAAAEQTGLVSFRDQVRFRHPLVRSAIYRSARLADRRAAHRALAESTDPRTDADRRAWHRARAAVGPDEDVAAELERCAGRAATHGGMAAAAAFLDQAAALTPDPVRRVRRSLDAAQVKAHAGAFQDALDVLAMAESSPLGRAEQARAEVLRARISFTAHRGNEALPLLLTAARRLEELDPLLSRDTYLDAMSAALFAGRLAAGAGASEVARAVRASSPMRWAMSRKSDVLLDGLTTLFTDGYPAAAPLLRDAVRAFSTEPVTLQEAMSSEWLSLVTASALWDDAGWDVLTRRHLAMARSSGALSALPLALDTRAIVELFTGDLAAAAALVEERRSVAEATRSGLAPYGEIGLVAVRGDVERAEPLIRACLEDVTARGEGVGVNLTQWARAVLYNGSGRYQEAAAAAREAVADPRELGLPQWALGELVEAAVHSGDAGSAATALAELSSLARASGTDWALGVEASRRALAEGGRTADELHREAIERLDRTRVELEAARARLLYGEWLRREGRRVDARVHLRAAHEAFGAIGAKAFAGRAARELQATGETIRRRTVEAPGKLTAQEAHIARLAAEGLTNPEIGAALYISPRTVEWHLRRIYSKLGVDNRRRLRQTLTG
ncbi:AAA family ATPase [Actinoplanes sp. M2I2]|uniref:ATP-binding protein n=1 Tax=Actinoplanes sp. M2I2 TaxID=1734444 RepID=UPI002021E42F|nr:AAA family ATPase [Actinoplanes sp. M2I2]